MFGIKSAIVLLFISLLFSSCKNEDSVGSKVVVNEVDTSIIEIVDKSKIDDEAETMTVKGNAVVFFTINSREFTDLIRQSGKYTKYDFDLIFKNFDRLANATKKISYSQKFKSYKCKARKFMFIGNSNDTFYFDREQNDLLLGVAFFKGDSQPIIEEGLLDESELHSKIKEYFSIENLDDIIIKLPVNQALPLFESDSVPVVKNDTLTN